MFAGFGSCGGLWHSPGFMSKAIAESDRYRHRMIAEPRPVDIDHLGHVSNIVYVRWILEVALAHSVAVGLGEDSYRDIDATFIIRRHEIDYLRPVLLGQTVWATTWVKSFRQASSVRATEIVVETGDGSETMVARAQTTWAWVGLTSGRPQRIPADILTTFCLPPSD